MMKTFLRYLIAPLAILALVGCAGGTLKITSALDPQRLDRTRGRALSVTSRGFQAVILVPIGTNGRQARAYKALLAEADGDTLADVTVTESWAYAFVGTIYSTTLSATAYPKIKCLSIIN